jgi:predicted lactoylglutathione lyase
MRETSMQNEFWLNLASKDLEKAREFFIKLGFKMNDRHASANMVSMFIGHKNVVLNLFPENLFQTFTLQPVTNTLLTNEVIFSIGASSALEVDAMAEKALNAGAQLFSKPGYKDGWMYGCGFSDLDGHRWNILYMDMSNTISI